MSNWSWSENINALYPRHLGRGYKAIFDRFEKQKDRRYGGLVLWNTVLKTRLTI